jgi:hypothetical protein
MPMPQCFTEVLTGSSFRRMTSAMAIVEDHAKTFAGGYISLLEGGRKALERSGADAADCTFHRRQLKLIG